VRKKTEKEDRGEEHKGQLKAQCLARRRATLDRNLTPALTKFRKVRMATICLFLRQL